MSQPFARISSSVGPAGSCLAASSSARTGATVARLKEQSQGPRLRLKSAANPSHSQSPCWAWQLHAWEMGCFHVAKRLAQRPTLPATATNPTTARPRAIIKESQSFGVAAVLGPNAADSSNLLGKWVWLGDMGVSETVLTCFQKHPALQVDGNQNEMTQRMGQNGPRAAVHGMRPRHMYTSTIFGTCWPEMFRTQDTIPNNPNTVTKHCNYKSVHTPGSYKRKQFVQNARPMH